MLSASAALLHGLPAACTLQCVLLTLGMEVTSGNLPAWYVTRGGICLDSMVNAFSKERFSRATAHMCSGSQKK